MMEDVKAKYDAFEAKVDAKLDLLKASNVTAVVLGAMVGAVVALLVVFAVAAF